VPYAVELYFDAQAERAVRELRAALGVPPVLDEMGERPHISLAVFATLDSDALAPHLQKFAARLAPFPVALVGVGGFASAQGVIYLAPEPDEWLSRAHGEFHLLIQSLGLQSNEYYLPRNWVPHCTIAQDVHPAFLEPAKSRARSLFSRIDAQVESIGIVSYRPARPLALFNLGS
jgi:2'-5' RNA ligase